MLSIIESRKSKTGANFFGFEPIKEFKGKVDESGFKIEKRLDYFNSFNPVIEGEIVNENKTPTLRVVMRLKESV